MIQIVRTNSGKILIKGSVDLGILGKYKDDMIDVDVSEFDYINEDKFEETILQMSRFYNDRFVTLSDHVSSINEQFCMWILTYLCDREYPFWQSDSDNKYPDYINEFEIKKFENNTGKIDYNPSSACEIYKEIQDYNIYTNIDDLSSHEIVDKYLKILNFKKFLTYFIPSSLNTVEEDINFTLKSNLCNGELFSSVYGTIDGCNQLLIKKAE